MPDLRLRADDRAQHHRPPQDGGREGRHPIRGAGACRHCREGRRRYARCPLHLRPGCQLLPGQHHLPEGDRRPERARQRQLLQARGPRPGEQGEPDDAAARQYPGQGIRRRKHDSGTRPARTQRDDGEGYPDPAAAGNQRRAEGKIRGAGKEGSNTFLI